MSNDLISRQAIKEKLQEHYDFFVNTYDGFENMPSNIKLRVDEITNCIAEVVNMPAVQPVQKTGRWKTRSEGRLHYCSECGWALMDTESGEPPYMGTDFNRSNEERWTCCPGWCGELMNFCPNCGAKMESEESE